MTKARQNQIIADVEKAGLKARRTKHGIMIQAPDGSSRTINTMSDGSQGLRGDIAWFREHGLTHPADKHKNEAKPKETEVARPAETNEEGYPLYMVGPINGTTRKRILANLESKGWPLRIMATDINMDTVTASRALYAVGYRWDPNSPARKRVWVAPEDIKEMHEKVKAEMKRREEEARAERHERTVHIEPGAIVVNAPPTPADVARTRDKIAEVMNVPREVIDPPIPTPDEVAEAIPLKPAAEPYRNPGKTIGEAATPDFLAENAPRPLKPTPPAVTIPHLHLAPPPAPEHEREFVDEVDSWTVDKRNIPRKVADYLRGLEAAGLNVEIRVWRNN